MSRHVPTIVHSPLHTHTPRAQTLALHLIEGVIDQVDGSVQVSWVQPRILTLPQIQGLRGRLDGWVDKVSAAALTLEADAVGVAVQEAI